MDRPSPSLDNQRDAAETAFYNYMPFVERYSAEMIKATFEKYRKEK